MRGKGMGLRKKMMLWLALAVVLPFLVGLLTIWLVAYPQHIALRGRLYQAEAASAGQALEQVVKGEVERVRLWANMAPELHGFLTETNQRAAAMDPQVLRAQIVQLEKEWPATLRNAEPVRPVLENPCADRMRAFQSYSPLVAEVLLADHAGRVIAATQKTTDFNQADEEWWQHGIAAKPGEVWVDALHTDESAEVYSIDLILAVGGERTEGVLKVVVNVTPLFRDLRRVEGDQKEIREIVLPDGHALVRIGKTRQLEELPTAPESVMATVRAKRFGWILGNLNGGGEHMIGYAPLEITMGSHRLPLKGFVLVAVSKDEVVAPVKRYLGMVFGFLVTVVGVCGLVSYWFVHRQVLGPLAVVSGAVRSLAAVTNGKSLAHASPELQTTLQEQATEQLQEIDKIHSQDEIGRLAKDFGNMSGKVLHYQSDLEAEVESKTSVIRQDLEMAREFQRALLPEAYPIIPPPDVNNPLRLGFTHLYQPATTVGGDFFDLLQLDDSRAGVLVADVMGHGARSALITAILRALVQHEGAQIREPAEFLQTLNHQLYEIIARSGQTLFVTAFFMILDTRNCTTSWAVAGHPAPLRIREGEKEARFLWEQSLHQPALGLMPEVVYQSYESELRTGDTFLIYTDGVIEADSPNGEAFGNERLRRLFSEAVDSALSDIPMTIIQELHEFQGRELTEDDVCLVAVQARAPTGHEADGLHT